MASVTVPGLDVDADSTTLFVVLGVAAALVGWLFYELWYKSGLGTTAKQVTGVADNTLAAVNNAVTAAGTVTSDVSTGLSTLSGQGVQTPGSNSNLFYTALNNFFSTGSIYGDN